jgi:DNA gyrase subunit A
MAEFKPIIEQSMKQYAGAVLQSRALVDVRDCLKPSARQIFYCMDKYKYTANKPFQKTMAAIGDAMKHFYIHGDSSCEGIIMRAGQPFAMRYPLVEVDGNGGTLLASGNWAAPRYTETRLSKLAAYLFNDIDKETIDDWRDNYADNEQYPGVLPTKGFYNLVNGTSGIGIGMACSVPQYNIRELNEALIHLIDNPNCDFEEIYCAPDFATGAIMYNETDVKESMRNGNGFACKLRSVVEFDSKERCFVVTEIPYGVYTNTICGQLEEIVNGEENPGIERFNDLTGSTPLIKIYLGKKSNPDKVLKYLFKNTSLQHHYGINFTMLDNGRYPKVFGWKEMLQAHIDHERTVYRRAFEFDLKKIKSRIHIIDGLLICMASIEEVVQTIRNSASSAEASKALQSKFLLDEAQTKAVLDMKLSRLAHLEVKKLENERADLQGQAEAIEKILGDEELFKEEIKKGWREVAAKFGDARRTKIINISKDDEEPTEIKSLQVSMTNKNNLFVSESSTLYTQKRGGVGSKAKLEAGEYVIHSESIESNEELAFFTRGGDFYHYPVSALAIGERIAVEALFGISGEERIVGLSSFNKRRAKKNIVFCTKNGIIKKSALSEYNLKRSGSLKAINLDSNDEIASILFIDDEDVGIMTEMGNFIRITITDIRAIGRVAKGVRGIKLNPGDAVCCAYPIPKDTQYIISVTSSGLFKKTPISEFSVQGKNTKGAKIHKLTDKDHMADFVSLGTETEILVASSRSTIKISINDVPTLSRVAQGAKAIKMNDTDKIIGIALY